MTDTTQGNGTELPPGEKPKPKKVDRTNAERQRRFKQKRKEQSAVTPAAPSAVTKLVDVTLPPSGPMLTKRLVQGNAGNGADLGVTHDEPPVVIPPQPDVNNPRVEVLGNAGNGNAGNDTGLVAHQREAVTSGFPAPLEQ